MSFSNDNPSHTQHFHHHHLHHRHHPPNILNSQISPLPSRVSQTFHGSSALWCLANPISRDEPSLINISKNFSIFNFAKTILIRDKQTQHRVCQLENLTERNVKVWSCVCYNLISMYGLDWTHSDILSPHCSLYFNIQILILYSSASLILVLIPVSLRITNSFLLTSFRPENYVAQIARLPADIKYETLKVYQHDTRIFLSLILSRSPKFEEISQ